MPLMNPNSPKIPGTKSNERTQANSPYGCNKRQTETFNPHHVTDSVALIQEVPKPNRQQLPEQYDDIAPVASPYGMGQSSNHRKVAAPSGMIKLDGIQPAKHSIK